VEVDNRSRRLLEFAPVYFDVNGFPDGDTKRALMRVLNKSAAKSGRTDDGSGRPNKKLKRK
jgi:pre-mRNA-splicing factor ATP-dependent RNA helicase DHX15/PRP43